MMDSDIHALYDHDANKIHKNGLSQWFAYSGKRFTGVHVRPVVSVAVGWPLVPTGHGYLPVQFGKAVVSVLVFGPGSSGDVVRQLEARRLRRDLLAAVQYVRSDQRCLLEDHLADIRLRDEPAAVHVDIEVVARTNRERTIEDLSEHLA